MNHQLGGGGSGGGAGGCAGGCAGVGGAGGCAWGGYHRGGGGKNTPHPAKVDSEQYSLESIIQV